MFKSFQRFKKAPVKWCDQQLQGLDLTVQKAKVTKVQCGPSQVTVFNSGATKLSGSTNFRSERLVIA